MLISSKSDQVNVPPKFPTMQYLGNPMTHGLWPQFYWLIDASSPFLCFVTLPRPPQSPPQSQYCSDRDGVTQPFCTHNIDIETHIKFPSHKVSAYLFSESDLILQNISVFKGISIGIHRLCICLWAIIDNSVS